MCLYPKIIQNPKYKKNQKNGGQVPPVPDQRIKYLPVGCGKCIECRKQERRKWLIRLLEHIKTHTNGKFVTLTFSNESIKEIHQQHINKTDVNGYIVKIPIKELKGYEKDNAIATRALRLFNERYRKTYKRAIHHWLVTELGHQGTENIHLHGIIWNNESVEILTKIWKYGYIWPRPESKIKTYVNGRTISYITKYISKIDHQHKEYKPIILTSPGIGKTYIGTYNANLNTYNQKETIETYRTTTGHKIALPIYYRNKIYTEEQREQLWINKLDQNTRWVCGEKIDITNGEEQYHAAIKWHRRINKELGYGNDEKNWNRKTYENERRELIIQHRINTPRPPSKEGGEKKNNNKKEK